MCYRVLRALLALVAAPLALCGQTNWPEALAKMPLKQPVRELNRSNAVPVMLAAFQRNAAVKALIFMPGATDEFYFFRRVHAQLTNSAPTLLDAVAALTNQTYIRATLRPPFLLLHTAEDPLEPIEVVEDQKTADSIRRHNTTRRRFMTTATGTTSGASAGVLSQHQHAARADVARLVSFFPA